MDNAILTNAKEIGDLKWQEFLLHDMKNKQRMDRIMHQMLQDLQRNCEDRRRRLLGNSEDELQNTQESLLAAVSREHDQMTSYVNRFAQILSSFRHLNVPKATELNEVMVQIKNKSLQFLETVESGGTIELEKVHQCTGQAKKVLVLLVQQVEQAKIKAAEDEKQRKEDERLEKKRQEEAKRVQRKEEEEAELRKKKEREEEEDKRAKATREGEAATMRQSPEDAAQQPLSSALIPVSNSVEMGEQVHEVSSSKGRRVMADGNLEMYTALQSLRKTFEEQSSSLINDSKCSQYRFKLQKAVMAPLNTLGAVTGPQLQKKLNSLLALLSGETVEVVGGRVSVKEHPGAVTFTQYYLAKQLVGKSESLASQRDVLFGLASLAVSIWCRNKDIGRLILSFLYLNCPYLSLIRLTKGDKSEEEFFKSLGYIIEDGNIEHESKFLDRMAGYVSLYAAIIISPPSSPSSPHPHGLEHAWKWLSSVVNSEPLPGITATLVFNFLDICGRRLMTTYGRQFWKLVELLNASFLPKVRTCGGDGGPTSRLEDFLSQALRTRNVREPQGFGGPSAWNAR